MADFHNYELAEIAHNPRGVLDLADGLLPEMAEATGYKKLGEQPTTESLRGFIDHIGPVKTLQDNIPLAQERLATQNDAVNIAADWAERSGCLTEIGRSFVSQDALPKEVDTAVFNTGVGRWQDRRAQEIIFLRRQGLVIGRVAIFAGNREMREQEHEFVAEMAKIDGKLPTETHFASQIIMPMLRAFDLDVNVIPVESSSGDEVFRQGIEAKSGILGDVTLAVGNAPATIQVAGQFRKAARSFGTGFDNDGLQLFMAGDTIPVARKGEPPATHQNPLTALGQIARNALVLHEQAQAFHSHPN